MRLEVRIKGRIEAKGREIAEAIARLRAIK